MIRWLIAIACALSLGGCTIAPATERTLALVRPVPVRAGGVRIYSEMCDVPGAMEVVGELEVANTGRKRAAIEREFATLAGRLGADAIVLHPFNTGISGAAYTNSGVNSFDRFRYSRATAIKVFADQSAPKVEEAGTCTVR